MILDHNLYQRSIFITFLICAISKFKEKKLYHLKIKVYHKLFTVLCRHLNCIPFEYLEFPK